MPQELAGSFPKPSVAQCDAWTQLGTAVPWQVPVHLQHEQPVEALERVLLGSWLDIHPYFFRGKES